MGVEPDNALGEYLRARRELADPADYGIRDAGRRRVRGLRREELAFLAGVSAPYYARLEQGRDRSPSPQILDAIAGVLRLDAEAAGHLHRLARPSTRGERSVAAAETIPAVVVRLVEGLPLQAVTVTNARRDVLAANPLAVALHPGFAVGRNLVRDAFLDPVTRDRFIDWHDIADASVAALRAGADIGDDPLLHALLAELTAASAEFAAMWARHDVHAKTTGVKRFRHPQVGELQLDYQAFAVNGTRLELQILSAEPGSANEAALHILATRDRSSQARRD